MDWVIVWHAICWSGVNTGEWPRISKDSPAKASEILLSKCLTALIGAIRSSTVKKPFLMALSVAFFPIAAASFLYETEPLLATLKLNLLSPEPMSLLIQSFPSGENFSQRSDFLSNPEGIAVFKTSPTGDM